MTTTRTLSRVATGNWSRRASGPSVSAATRPAMRASTIGVTAKARGWDGLRMTDAMRVATRYAATTMTTDLKRIGDNPPVHTGELQPEGIECAGRAQRCPTSPSRHVESPSRHRDVAVADVAVGRVPKRRSL